MDGATLTDMASNSAPTYYDFEMFEEIQITTGGMDASQETGSVSNFGVGFSYIYRRYHDFRTRAGTA